MAICAPARNDCGMRSYWIASDGARTRLEAREVPQPSPGAGQLLVRVRAAGLNRGEFLVGGLSRPGAAKPAGIEAAGEVVGSGKRVMGRANGAFSEFALMGDVPPRTRRPEGPFGDHYGYYSLQHDYPVFEVRRDRKSVV